MRIRDTFMLRQVADETLVIPIGEAAMTVKGLIGLSESGALLCNALQNGADEQTLVRLLLEHYDIDRETAAADTSGFLEQMRRMGILEEEA